MSTPHNLANPGDIAKVVLMPGDPLRAEYIANKYLSDVKKVNSVRNMYAFTGKYKGKEITVMGSGMGMPSIGIYSYELYKFYGVESIIRIGSAGSYTEDCDLFDVVLADSAYSESTFAKVFCGEEGEVMKPSQKLNDVIIKTAEKLGKKIHLGCIHSSDVFYHTNDEYYKKVKEHKCLAVEMESFALFANAKYLGKNAACILTISDSLVTHKETTAEERQNSFNEMMELALNSALNI